MKPLGDVIIPSEMAIIRQKTANTVEMEKGLAQLRGYELSQTLRKTKNKTVTVSNSSAGIQGREGACIPLLITIVYSIYGN